MASKIVCASLPQDLWEEVVEVRRKYPYFNLSKILQKALRKAIDEANKKASELARLEKLNISVSTEIENLKTKRDCIRDEIARIFV